MPRRPFLLLLAIAVAVLAGAWWALRGPGVDDVPKLIAQLVSAPDRGVFRATAEQLVEVGAGAVPILLEALQHGDDQTRPAVARFFSQVEALQGAPPAFYAADVRRAIQDACRSDHWPTRAAAARALVLQHHPVDPTTLHTVMEIHVEAMSRAQEPTSQRDTVERTAIDDAKLAAFSLHMAVGPSDTQLVRILTGGLEDERESARIFSIGLLGRLGSTATQTLPRLEELLERAKARERELDEAARARGRRYAAEDVRRIEDTMSRIRGE